METIKILITPEDFKNAPNGYIGDECPLAQSLLRRGLITEGDYVMTASKILDRKAHVALLGIVDWEKNWGGDYPAAEKNSYAQIQEWSEKAKESLEGIPTVELELIKY